MHRSVWEYLAKNKEKLLGSFNFRDHGDTLRVEWWQIPESAKDYRIIASDGSYNYIVKDVNVIFALTGLVMKQQNRSLEDLGISYVGIIERNIYTRRIFDEFLSMWMRLAEIKSVLKVIKEEKDNYIILMDGSFASDVISPKPTERWVEHITKKSELHNIEEEIKSNIEYIRREFLSKDFVFPELADRYNENFGIFGYAQSLLLYYEYMIAIENLTNLKQPILFITKDSYSNRYVQLWEVSDYYISDQAMFNKCTSGKGFAPPLVMNLEDVKKKLMDEFVHILDIDIYETFVRFSDNAPSTYKVEILNVEDQSNIVDILGYISKISPLGYPQPLEIAHREVKISSKDMKGITDIILPFHRGARDVLQ